MTKTCPFCRTEIPFEATICPNCIHDTRDLESVFGPPPTFEERLRSIQATAPVDGCVGIIRLVLVLTFAMVGGVPLLPVILIGVVLIGFILLCMHAIKSISEGRHDG